jgi:hypothetical protein
MVLRERLVHLPRGKEADGSRGLPQLLKKKLNFDFARDEKDIDKEKRSGKI